MNVYKCEKSKNKRNAMKVERKNLHSGFVCLLKMKLEKNKKKMNSRTK